MSQRPTQPPPEPVVEKRSTISPSGQRKRVPFSGAYSIIFEEPKVDRTTR